MRGRSFIRDRRGVAAVEFALIAPVLILIYMGLAEMTMALMAERRSGHAAAVVADLIAQDTMTNKGELDDVFAIAEEILTPFPAAGMKVRITAVRTGGDAVPKVVWSHGKGFTAYSKDSTVTGIPAGLLAANETLIMSEVTYSFDSPAKYVLKNALNFRQEYFLRPRKLEMVTCTDC